MSCATCRNYPAKVGMAEGDVKRAVRRAIASGGAPRDVAAIERAKTVLADNKARLADHDCTNP